MFWHLHAVVRNLLTCTNISINISEITFMSNPRTHTRPDFFNTKTDEILSEKHSVALLPRSLYSRSLHFASDSFEMPRHSDEDRPNSRQSAAAFGQVNRPNRGPLTALCWPTVAAGFPHICVTCCWPLLLHWTWTSGELLLLLLPLLPLCCCCRSYIGAHFTGYLFLAWLILALGPDYTAQPRS